MLYTVLLGLMVIGALLAAVTGFRALRAWLRYRRARVAFQGIVTEEVENLARRTAEIEKNLSALDARAQQLPVKVSELQRSLSTLKVLTGALTVALGRSRQALSYNPRESLGSLRASGGRTGDER